MSVEILIALVESAEDRDAIERGVGGTRVHFCSRAQDVIELLPDLRVVGVVLELRAASRAAAVQAIVDARKAQGRVIPLLLRFELRRAALRQHHVHLTEDPTVRFSVRGYDELARCVATLLAIREITSARGPIVARLLQVVSDTARNIVVGAATIGEQDYVVRDLAHLCGMSQRSLEDECTVVGLPTPKRMLKKAFALHTLFRVTELGMNPKRAASVAGLKTDPLSRRIERETGLTLIQWSETYSFDDELEKFADQLRG